MLRSVSVYQILKAVTFDVIHNDDEAVILIDHIDDARQVGMVELFEHFRLCHKVLADNSRIISAVLADFFYSPGLVCTLI